MDPPALANGVAAWTGLQIRPGMAAGCRTRIEYREASDAFECPARGHKSGGISRAWPGEKVHVRALLAHAAGAVAG